MRGRMEWENGGMRLRVNDVMRDEILHGIGVLLLSISGRACLYSRGVITGL
jgi:hypothetical protein